MDDIKILLGKRIKELRLNKKMSQEELAEKINIAERNLSKIECGNNFLRADKINNLCAVFGITPKELFDFEHHQDLENIRKILIDAINKDDTNLRIIYQIFKIFNP